MIPQTLRRSALVALAALMFAAGQAPAQQAFDLRDWRRQWQDLETSDSLTAQQRLAGQTTLVQAAGPLCGWGDPVVWAWTLQVLNGWESSPDVEDAWQAYFSLLASIGETAGPAGQPLPDEAALREYLQRALGIARTSGEQGRLLFYLAESLLRSAPDSTEALRRAEAWLQQAVLALPAEPPLDAVHWRLGELYTRWGTVSTPVDAGEQSFLSRAVFHFRCILDMESARPDRREQAQSALDELLRPGLQFAVGSRFLPGNEVRVSITTRNLAEVRVEVCTLPWLLRPVPLSVDRMRSEWLGTDPLPEQVVLDSRFPLAPRHRFDWQTEELALGEELPSGWYRVRVFGAGLVAEDLLLVTPLELVLIPRDSGELVLWAADVETGQPVIGGRFHVLDAAGGELAVADADEKGMAVVRPAAGSAWAEVHIADGLHPGVVRRADLPAAAPPAPWIIPGALEVSPGAAVEWLLVGTEAALADVARQGQRLLLPDGSQVDAQLAPLGAGIMRGSATIPATAETAGPVHLQLPGDGRFLLTHLRPQRLLPFVIDFSGERLLEKTSLFLSSTPVGMRLFNNSGAGGLPEYIRVQALPQQRRIIDPADAAAQAVADEPVFDTIMSLAGSDGVGAFLELPRMLAGDDVRVLRIEITALDSGNLLGAAYLALVPFRLLVDLTLSEHIIRTGRGVEVRITLPGGQGVQPRAREGELVLFRETWQSRYIHRKKGTTIGEAEYLELPDRSLLGSAKTDYRLLEEGFVREEVRRIAVDLARQDTIPVTLDNEGYFRIEYQDSEADIIARYPHGPLEVWVVPPSGDLRAFRSDKPRLVLENNPDGGAEILLLMDRADVSVLLESEFISGPGQAQVLRPQGGALFLETPASGSALRLCRAILVGERRTDTLSRQLELGAVPQWKLGAERGTGLNPGAAFEWPLQQSAGDQVASPVWTIYPEQDGGLIEDLLDRQAAMRAAADQGAEVQTLTLENWLHLYHPLEIIDQVASRPAPAETAPMPSPVSLLALFPELKAMAPAPAAPAGFTILAGDRARVSGRMPDTAGRWALTLFSPQADNRVSWQTWPFSTELPIRASLSGPAVMRVGDLAGLTLRLENTTYGQETLQLLVEQSGNLSLLERPRDSAILNPGQTMTLPIVVDAATAGTGTIKVHAAGRDSSSESLHEIVSRAPRSLPAVRVFSTGPGRDALDLQVPVAGWSAPRLLVSSGLGAVLAELWPPLRSGQEPGEGLLVTLGDWSLERALVRHGLAGAGTSQDATGRLRVQLQRAVDGALAWNPGFSADPWLTALALWSVETFSPEAAQGFPDFIEPARQYLESILIRDDIDRGARLLALQALAAPAFLDPGHRPSRLQARSFLSFLQDRADLDDAELAQLLQAARAYRFNEEVRLLTDELSSRLRTGGASERGDVWSLGLAYLALEPGGRTAALRDSILRAALESLERAGLHRSWRQVSGFLALLAAFLDEGDFNVDGEALVALDDGPLAAIPLNPDSPDGGRFVRDLAPLLEGRNAFRLRLEAPSARGQVFALITGSRAGAAPCPAFPEQSEKLTREFVEETLLAGPRRQVIPVTESTTFTPGDTLQILLSLYFDEAVAGAEIHFAIPAGTVLAADAIEHFHESAGAATEPDKAPQALLEQRNPLRQVLRFERLEPGRHDFVLAYRINWAGTYSFPAHELVLPRSGQCFEIGSSHVLRIAAPAY